MLFARKAANKKRSRVESSAPSAVLATLALISVSLAAALVYAPPACATRPPENIKDSIKQTFPNARVRLDGVVEKTDGTLYIPLIPKTVNAKSAPGLSAKYPAQTPVLFAFSNGWYYLKLSDKDGKKVLALPALKDDEKKKIAACMLPPDLIVPLNMFVSPELKASIGEVRVPILGTPAPTSTTVGNTPPAGGETKAPAGKPGATKAATGKPGTAIQPAGKPATTSPAQTSQLPVDRVDEQPVERHETAGADGLVAVTSPQTGKIALLSSSMNKLGELPTDGTPGGMATAGGKLFIADQTKNRILIVDPQKREFAGQIDFPPGSSPKDVAAQADGTFLYVSECAANKIAIVELATQKILMHTLVPAGPTRMEVAPNGYTLLVLNVPAGKVSFISTLNQKLVGVVGVFPTVVEVGAGVPSDVMISKDSRTAYVSNRLSNTVSVIDVTQKRVLRTMPTGEGPTGMALSKDGTRLFVANAKENSISVFDLKSNTKIKDVSLPIDVEFPSDIMLMPDGQRMLVTSAATDTLGMLNVETLEFEKQQTLGCTSVDLIWVPQ